MNATTATLPAGWSDRLVPLANDNTGGSIGWCLEVHDLAVSKLVAGREKDLDFLRVLVRAHMVNPVVLAERVRIVMGAEVVKDRATRRLAQLVPETR